MELIEKAVSKKDYASLPKLMTDKWLEDVSFFGSHSEVREGIEKWYETGPQNSDPRSLIRRWWSIQSI